MKAIYALYNTPEAAQHAVDNLRAAGVKDPEITIQSSEPMEEYEFGQRDRSSTMFWIGGLGGLIGMVSAYLLTSLTQQSWPIVTGGMPIVSNWTNMIVIFELTMLGAVFASVITLLITAKIPSRLPELYDAEVSDGKILIGVAHPRPAILADVQKALLDGGAKNLKTIQ